MTPVINQIKRLILVLSKETLFFGIFRKSKRCYHKKLNLKANQIAPAKGKRKTEDINVS